MNRQIHKTLYRSILFLIFCLLAFFLTAEDFLINGDFENGVADWSFTSTTSAYHGHETGFGRNSTDCVIISSPNVNTDSYWKQAIDLVPGDPYILSGWVKPIDVAEGYGAGIGYTGSVDNTSAYSPGLSGRTDWQYVFVEFTAEAGGEIRLRLGHNGQSSEGSVRFDDIMLEDKYGNKMLVIVASSIYGEGQLAAALDSYHNDLLYYQDWWTKNITLDADEAGTGDYNGLDAAGLKEVIRDDFYKKGYDGIFFVGSPPDIPLALWRSFLNPPPGDSNDLEISDLFFADMDEEEDDWVDSDLNGIYELKDYNSVTQQETWLRAIDLYNPELIYGRVSAYDIKPSVDVGYDEDEADLITAYFTRIGDYRHNGNSSTLTATQKNRGVYFRDDSWNSKLPFANTTSDIKNMQEASPNISVYLDEEVTSETNYFNILKEGNRFLDLGHHGNPTAVTGYIEDWDSNHEPYLADFALSEIKALTGTDRPNAEFLNLFVCYDGRYADPVTKSPQACFAGAYLFNSTYMLNVAASTSGGIGFGHDTFFSGLNNEDPVGVAMRNMIIYAQTNFTDTCVPRILFGDPLLVYPPGVSTNKGPVIKTQLRDQVIDYNTSFTLAFDVEDDNDDEEDIDLSLDHPASINYDSPTKTLTWTPSSSDIGTNTVITAVAEDTSGYTNTEPFTIYVRERTVSGSYQCSNTSATTNQLAPRFKVKNETGSTIDLTDVKILYWFTRDAEVALDSACDYAAVGSGNITRNFYELEPDREGADYYLEIGFTAGAGSLANGSDTGEIQIRIWKTDYSNFEQSNDYSFDPDFTSYGENTAVTFYYNGDICFGMEPDE